MIRGFKDRKTKQFFEGKHVPTFSGFADQASRRLTVLDNAESLRDLAVMSSKNTMRPVHPGEILREELSALNMSAKAFSVALNVPGNRITMILKGQRGITADTALRISRYLGTTPELWLNLQKSYELREAQLLAGEEINKSVVPRRVAA